jgi:cytochrome oxidase Cu insertion factor (SCO1/SenC/PrrC family)
MAHLPASSAAPPARMALSLLLALTACLATARVAAAAPADDAGKETTARIAGPPAVGSPAPAFALRSSTGDEHRLADLKGKSHLVLVFFRGTW